MMRSVIPKWEFFILLAAVGCAAPQSLTSQPMSNPFQVAANNQESVWERAVDFMHEYGFPIVRENKFDGIIETGYKVGAGVLEPWHRDAVGAENRWEGTLQSIRRRAFVSITPIENGYLVGVQVFKELEDLPGMAANSAGEATFQESEPLRRDLNSVVGQSTPSGWIPQGRDFAVEQDMLRRMQPALSR